MIHFDTKAPAMGHSAGAAASIEARVRQAAMVVTLAVGVPLVLVWFGLLGWGVVWLARSALAL